MKKSGTIYNLHDTRMIPKSLVPETITKLRLYQSYCEDVGAALDYHLGECYDSDSLGEAMPHENTIYQELSVSIAAIHNGAELIGYAENLGPIKALYTFGNQPHLERLAQGTLTCTSCGPYKSTPATYYFREPISTVYLSSCPACLGVYKKVADLCVAAGVTILQTSR
jgi:hypothetical protein